MSGRDCHTETINGHTFRMRYLSGGIFSMGDPQNRSIWKAIPVHQVELSPYYIGEYLVTQALWKAVMGKDHNPSGFIGDKRPVERVSWIDIREGNQEDNGQPAFVDRINELTKDSRPEGYTYNLPSEAQWEFAARAGTNYAYAGSDQLKEVGWFGLNSHEESKEVGLLQPNDFGLYDMSGNVDEWCLDAVSDDFYQKCADLGTVKDPVDREDGQLRVYRGGSWISGAGFCRVSRRGSWYPARRDGSIGFRLVLAPVQ